MKVFENGKWVIKNGGLVTGPTLVKNYVPKNPEIFSPLEKLKKHLGIKK